MCFPFPLFTQWWFLAIPSFTQLCFCNSLVHATVFVAFPLFMQRCLLYFMPRCLLYFMRWCLLHFMPRCLLYFHCSCNGVCCISCHGVCCISRNGVCCISCNGVFLVFFGLFDQLITRFATKSARNMYYKRRNFRRRKVSHFSIQNLSYGI